MRKWTKQGLVGLCNVPGTFFRKETNRERYALQKRKEQQSTCDSQPFLLPQDVHSVTTTGLSHSGQCLSQGGTIALPPPPPPGFSFDFWDAAAAAATTGCVRR